MTELGNPHRRRVSGPLAAIGRRAESREASPRAVLVVMCVGYFLVLLDVTIVTVALPKIGAGVGASVSGLQCVVDGYALALASLMLAGGTVGDLHGHKRVVLTGLVGTLAIISHAYPEGPEQARAIGIWAGIGSLALPAGPLLGGALVDGFGSRAIFAVNVPIVLAALVAAVVIVRESTEPQGRRLDVRGVALGVLTLLAITFAFIDAGRSGAGSPAVIAAAAAAVILLGAFILTERSRGDGAMLPLALFRRRGFSVANGAAGTMNLGTLGTLFVLTLFLQSVQGHSPLVAGLWIVPLFAPLAIIAPAAGRLTSRIGSRLPVAAGLAVAAVGLALLVFAEPGSSYLTLLPALLLWGSGLGILTPAVVATAIAAVPGERAGLASAINNTARQAGGAIGIAVAGAVAGQPGSSGFLTGFHAVAAGAACLYGVAALLGLTLVPGEIRPT